MCDPEPGDLIEIKRRTFNHWALYLGDGYVIHVTLEEASSSSASNGSVGSASVPRGMAKVKKELLNEVVEGDFWRISNKYDNSHTPQPVAEIIRQANSYIDKRVPYNIFKKNCEHFVTLLRYGRELSDQARLTLRNLCLHFVNWLGSIL